MLAGLVPSEASVLSLWIAVLSLCPHMIIPSVCVCVPISSSYKDTSHIGLGPTLVTSFYLNHLFKDPICKYLHILRGWVLGFKHMNLRR